MEDLNLKNQLTTETHDFFPLDPDFEKEVDSLADDLAEKAAQEQKDENKLLPFDALKERIKEEIKDSLLMRKLGRTLFQATSIINDEGTNLSQDERQHLIADFAKALERLDKMELNDLDNKTFQQITEITQKTLDIIEVIGQHKYAQGDYRGCSALFTLLCLLNPVNFNYWTRLGIAKQECQNFEEALDAYDQALTLNPEDVRDHLFSAECFVRLGDKNQAKDECKTIKDLINNEKNQDWDNYLSSLERAVNDL